MNGVQAQIMIKILNPEIIAVTGIWNTNIGKKAFIGFDKVFFLINFVYVEWRIGHYKVAFFNQIMRAGIKAVALNDIAFKAKVHLGQARLFDFNSVP